MAEAEKDTEMVLGFGVYVLGFMGLRQCVSKGGVLQKFMIFHCISRFFR